MRKTMLVIIIIDFKPSCPSTCCLMQCRCFIFSKF